MKINYCLVGHISQRGIINYDNYLKKENVNSGILFVNNNIQKLNNESFFLAIL